MVHLFAGKSNLMIDADSVHLLASLFGPSGAIYESERGYSSMNSCYTRLLPKYAQNAFDEWYAYGANNETCEAFAGTWGGVFLEHFLCTLKQGQGDDRLCATFGLETSRVPACGFLEPCTKKDGSHLYAG